MSNYTRPVIDDIDEVDEHQPRYVRPSVGRVEMYAPGRLVQGVELLDNRHYGLTLESFVGWYPNYWAELHDGTKTVETLQSWEMFSLLEGFLCIRNIAQFYGDRHWILDPYIPDKDAFHERVRLRLLEAFQQLQHSYQFEYQEQFLIWNTVMETIQRWLRNDATNILFVCHYGTKEGKIERILRDLTLGVWESRRFDFNWANSFFLLYQQYIIPTVALW